MAVDVRVISIGAMSSHPLRGESPGVRTGHATTTLITLGPARILVDPSLPGQVVAARLEERAGIRPAQVTHVFLTSFNPELRRGLMEFEKAAWLIGEAEREAVGTAMAMKLRELAGDDDAEDESGVRTSLEREVAILRRCEPAPDTLAAHKGERVDLFPLPGVTPGLCGLLVPTGARTTLVCGDAVPTVEHLERGVVLTDSADVNQARESFAEAVEIADVLVLGRDNAVPNPVARGLSMGRME